MEMSPIETKHEEDGVTCSEPRNQAAIPTDEPTTEERVDGGRKAILCVFGASLSMFSCLVIIVRRLRPMCKPNCQVMLYF